MPILASSRVVLARHPPPHNLLRALFQLPPSCRAFHASPPPRFLETIISPAHALFEGIHSATGLPWAYAIPLTALTIRTIFILPASIYTRRILQKQAELTPVINAWGPQFQKDATREAGHLGPVAAQSAFTKRARRKTIEIYRRWGCQRYKVYIMPLLQLPIFLMTMETLRMMCGYSSGLLGLIATSFGAETVALVDTEKELTSWFTPSLATEGTLWFPDLTKPDPELRLPFIFSGVMLLNVFGLRWKRQTQSNFARRVQNSLGMMALFAGPILMNLPSSMFVYWISASVFAQGQAFLLDRLMPIKSVKPCQPKQGLGIGSLMTRKLNSKA